MRDVNYSEEQAVVAYQNVKEKNYWSNRLSGNLVKTHFPYDYRKTDAYEHNFGAVKFRIVSELFSRLIEVSQGSDHALHMVMTSITVILLNKYTGKKDILVGTPIYKQDSEEEGEFVNTVLVLRNRLQGNMTFKELLFKVKHTISEAVEHQNYPMGILLRDLNIPVYKGEFPLFDTVILLENIHDRKDLQHIHANMTISLLRTRVSLEGTVEYNLFLYEKATVERIISHLQNLLKNAVSNPGLQLADLDIFSQEEWKQILFDFNMSKADYPQDKTLHQQFEEQVEKTPDKIAVLFEDRQLTYRDLNEKANRLAHVLRKKGAAANTIVGLVLERSLEMMIGIFGILKAGGAYLPIDPTLPTKRIKMMLDDCRALILLTDSHIIGKYSFTELQALQEIRVKPRITCKRPHIDNLDGLLMPDRSLVNYEKYNQYIGQALVKHCISLQATRGCPFKCAYCHNIWPKNHVVRSAENIFAEVQYYYNIGVRRFAFIDDIFNLDIKNSTRFFQLIIENKMDLQLFFPNGLRGDIMTKEYIDLMIEAGTINVALALETASPRLQKMLRKNLNLKKFKENIEYITMKYPHVILELFTMHRFPTETKEEALMTLNFIKSVKWFHFPYVFVLKVFPNTEMEKLAVDSGVNPELIYLSDDLPYHELPDTLPFEKSFTLNYQADFFNNYFLSKRRLIHVLPYQMKILTENEIVQKYNSSIPGDINDFDDLLQYFGISRDELGVEGFLDEAAVSVINLNENISKHFPAKETSGNGFRVLLLDLSQHFSWEADQVNDLLEPPLGLIYLMTYLNRQFGDKINGKIAKAQIDFDNYAELKSLLEDFQPDVIGIRTLSLYKDFFHKTVGIIRQWGIEVPIISGGPYATSSYETILQDPNVDLLVMGEGEITFAEIIKKMIKNGGKLPHEAVLEKIAGIAFTSAEDKRKGRMAREILLFDISAEESCKDSYKNPAPVNKASDPVYVIFTSGSTGKPKGTLTSHYNVTRVVRDTNYINLTRDDRILQLSNYAFDGSVFDIYGALLNGATLIMLKEEGVFSIDELANLILREGITVFFVTTAMFNRLAEEKPGCLTNVRKLLFGGEKVSVRHVKKVLGHLGKNRIIHVYGPTETTVYASYYPVNEIDELSGTVPIGKPISNTAAYVLDENMKPVPKGGCGELYIGGDGVAMGYLNNVDLTKEKFLKNPFVEEDCLYRTGDIVRMLEEGDIEFVDRLDNQVKLRGFRVELGEIECQLMKHDKVKSTVVLPREDENGDKYLCAYIVLDKNFTLTASDLRKYLSRDLPNYMVPSFFISLEAIPLTPNGKIDMKALPEPMIERTGDEYAAPRDEMEKKLVIIWYEVLGIGKSNAPLGIEDNFFQLGGHSLKATLLIAKIHKAFNVKINIREIFGHPTIRELAEYLKTAVVDKYSEVEPVEKKEYYDLSHSQRRVWVQSQFKDASLSFNIPTAYIIEEELDIGAFSRIFETIRERHESLRTVFITINEEPKQKILDSDEIGFHLEYIDLKEDKDRDIKSREGVKGESVTLFDLSGGPLFRVKFIRLEEKKYLFLLTMHHIISDAVSMQVLYNEMLLLYNRYIGCQEGQDRVNPLKPLRVQYKDYAAWHNKQLTGDEVKPHRNYWLNKMERRGHNLELPLDKARPAIATNNGNSFSLIIAGELTNRMRRISDKNDTTLFMTLLAVFNVFLYGFTSETDIIVGTPVAGREHAALEGQIGYYLNTLALRIRFSDRYSFGELLREVKKVSLEAFEHQIYPFDRLLDDLGIERDISRHPLFDVMIDMINYDLFEYGYKEPGKELKVRPFETGYNKSKFDLVLYLFESKDSINVSFEYNIDLFEEETISYMADYFQRLVSSIAGNPGCSIRDLVVAVDEEPDFSPIRSGSWEKEGISK
jgi:amino acid adenylation domain-containing protein